jgi:multidrug transporter EmrE-like cation transporter
MNVLWLFAWVALYMVASAWTGVQLKIAAEKTGQTAVWYFAGANVIGILCPVALMFALRHGNPNVVYALCYGSAFAALQIASYWLFKQPLSIVQWAGVFAVGIGIFLLQVR